MSTMYSDSVICCTMYSVLFNRQTAANIFSHSLPPPFFVGQIQLFVLILLILLNFNTLFHT